jgi:hypothetical protein
MANATYKEFKLFCPICNVTFTQLVVLHKLPENFNIDRYLAGMVESHNHKEYQAYQARLADPEKAGE